MTPTKYLNLGCGSRHHPEWINVDINPSAPEVVRYDLRRGIPFAEKSFEVVYHSHVLEHLHKTQAPFFLKECWRVLKPGGIIRVVVPNLEVIVRNYLTALDEVTNGHRQLESNYDWMMLELYDQTVREEPGGEMIKYLQQDPIPNPRFVYERIGVEMECIIQGIRRDCPSPSRSLAGNLNRTRAPFQFVRSLKEKLVAIILGKEDYKALLLGRFRLGGEVHLWMYDRFSLSRLLIQAGFNNPVERGPSESAIPNWSNYNLDTEPEGTVNKPDSFFMEAVKP